MRPFALMLVLPLIAAVGCNSKRGPQLGENGRIPVFPPESVYDDERDETTRNTLAIPLERSKNAATLKAFYIAKGKDLVKPESITLYFMSPFPKARPLTCKWTTQHAVTINYDGKAFTSDGAYTTQPDTEEMMKERVEVVVPLATYKEMVAAKALKFTVGANFYELGARQRRSLVQLGNSTL